MLVDNTHLMLALFKIKDKLLSQEVMIGNRNNTKSYSRYMSHTGVWTVHKLEGRMGASAWKMHSHASCDSLGLVLFTGPGLSGTPWKCWLWKAFHQNMFLSLGLAHRTQTPKFKLKNPDHRIRLSQFLTANMPGGHPSSAVVAAFCKELGHAVNMSWKWEKDFNSGEVGNYFLLCLAFFQCLPERCFLIPLDSLFPTESS